MTPAVAFLHAHHGPLPDPLQPLSAVGQLLVVERSLRPDLLDRIQGLILPMHADQIALAEIAPALARFIAARGRIAFNGHVLRQVLPGLEPFVPSGSGSIADLRLTELAPHPVFAGVSRAALQTRRGVAGFYGRGHNPPPPGAVALTGVGPAAAPLDWVWPRLGGGAFFSHAGNDLWTAADDPAVAARLAENLVRWCGGEGAP